MALYSKNVEDLTKKCQEIFKKLILENKDEIEALNKKNINELVISTSDTQNKSNRRKSMTSAPPNSYGMYGPSNYQCDIECMPSFRSRSKSVPVINTVNITKSEIRNQINSLAMEKINEPIKEKYSTYFSQSIEPIQEDCEFKPCQRAKSISRDFKYKYNAKIKRNEELIESLLQQEKEKNLMSQNLSLVIPSINGHSRSHSLSSISESDVLSTEDIIKKEKELDNKMNSNIKKGPSKACRCRSNSYCYGYSHYNLTNLDEYKKKIENEVYRQQIKRYEQMETNNIERRNLQKFLKWQETDYQKKRSSWSFTSK